MFRQRLDKKYWLFATLRLVLTLIPQTGYFHPDEFFQNVEILAGRTFKFEASLPWEFNVTAPIRSIGVSYITVGVSYQFLNILNRLMRAFFNIAIVTPYTLLITPRLIICCFSFICDYVIYLISAKNNEAYSSRLVIFASSYVCLTYATRTFTNTLEMILFAALLYYVADSMIFSNIVTRQREYLNKRYANSANATERAKFHKLRLFLASDSYRNCFMISNITVLGFFNRPTFLLFALFPIFFWLYRGIGFKSVNVLEFNVRILLLLLSALPMLLLLILVDSFFYGYISWGEIGVLDISINSFVFPAWNFIKYNMDSDNLANHGLHQWYQHGLVNVPLLFNVLGAFGLIGAIDISLRLLQGQVNMLPTVRSIKGLMTMSFIAPIAILSLFPHQEPRFILPVLVPLVHLYANKIKEDIAYDVVKSDSKDHRSASQSSPSSSNSLMCLWLIFNVFLTVFYGFIHQAGVIPAACYFAKQMQARPHYDYHLVTSHMYSIPHVLFMQPDPDTTGLLTNAKGIKYKATKKMFTYEEGSKDIGKLLKQMHVVLTLAANNKRRYKMYLLMSGTKQDVLELHHRDLQHLLRIEHIASFYPHFSGEALPLSQLSELWHLVSAAKVNTLQFGQIYSCLKKVAMSLSLKMYEIVLI